MSLAATPPIRPRLAVQRRRATIVLYDTGSTARKGKRDLHDQRAELVRHLVGRRSNVGRFTATLTSDNTMDFNFIEDKYTPAKTFVYVGARLEQHPGGGPSGPSGGDAARSGLTVPMKVLLLAPQPFYQERGTPIAVRLLAETLCSLGHAVDLLVYHEGEEISHPGLRLLRARRRRWCATSRSASPGRSWRATSP